MTNHQNPRRNLIAERFKFNMGNQRNDESISQYIAELQRLSQYGSCLEHMARDRFSL